MKVAIDSRFFAFGDLDLKVPENGISARLPVAFDQRDDPTLKNVCPLTLRSDVLNVSKNLTTSPAKSFERLFSSFCVRASFPKRKRQMATDTASRYRSETILFMVLTNSNQRIAEW